MFRDISPATPSRPWQLESVAQPADGEAPRLRAVRCRCEQCDSQTFRPIRQRVTGQCHVCGSRELRPMD